jgi:predicted alpha/beta-fold hydrolase
VIEFDAKSFRQRFPWWGGDLQTIATGRCPPPKIPDAQSKQMKFKLDEHNTLFAMLDSPVTPPDKDLPLVLLIHGVPGSQDSRYMLRMSSYLIKQGHRVLRLNLHGAGPSRAECAGQYYAGSSGDLVALLAQLPGELKQDRVTVTAVGYSVGGAILLKYLGEQGENSLISAAASVSAPIDLFDTCRTLMRFRNVLYHRGVLTKMKKEATDPGAVLTPDERKNIESARTIFEYDDRFTAPRNHFDGAEDYYFKCSAVNFLPAIRKPTLLLASLDDPWVPGGVYVGHRWGSNESLSLKPILTSRGGHVGFHGAGYFQPWSDRAVAKFFADHDFGSFDEEAGRVPR